MSLDLSLRAVAGVLIPLEVNNMTRSVQIRVKEMYEAHPFPHFADPFDPEWIKRYQLHFHYLGATPERFKDALVLDAGCGTGEKSLYMAGLGARQVT